MQRFPILNCFISEEPQKANFQFIRIGVVFYEKVFDNVNIKIYIGKDSYYVEASEGVGMSNPVMVGAAPELKDSKTYVPAVMITMLRHYDNLSKAMSKPHYDIIVNE